MVMMRKAPPVGHLLVKGLDGRTLCLRFPGDFVASGANVERLLSARTGIPGHCFRLVTGNTVVRHDSFLTSEDGRFPSCSLLLRLPGGMKAKDDRVAEFQEPDGLRGRQSNSKRKVEEDAVAKLLDEAAPPRLGRSNINAVSIPPVEFSLLSKYPQSCGLCNTRHLFPVGESINNFGEGKQLARNFVELCQLAESPIYLNPGVGCICRASKRARFPKGKKDSGAMATLQDPVIGEEGGGPILATDPRLAAKERALQRTVLNEKIITAKDVSLADDTVTAEEKGATARLEDGITIEPFNLNQEREEGFFDAQGNYVEYRLNEDDKDAWFETAEVDESLQAKKIKEKEMAKEDTELTTEERWVLQKRIANTLLPGETILQAFRRLRGVTKDKKWAPPMVGETKQIFDRLTEDAMKLLDNGDYNIYHEDKETLQREADGYEALARARKGEPSGSNGTTQHPPQSTAGDMFGDDDSFDMFGGDDDVPLSTTAGETSGDVLSQTEQISNTLHELPGYVYDTNSGYYYNANDGYFYDKKSGLFCNAASGKWFMYDGANASYLEVSDSGDTVASMTSVGAEA